jgi:hypothetical protein
MTGLPGLGWMVWALVLAVALAVLGLGLKAFGERRWERAMQALRDKLEAGRTDGQRAGPAPPAHYDEREIEGLPAPVQRYFRAALRHGQPIVAAVSIRMAGTFNLSPTGAQWKPFTSQQRITTRRPGFVWDATIGLLPGVTVRVLDSCIEGRGLLRASVLGLYTVAELQGEGDIACGEFMRWFAEVAWYPTALLPSQGVRWAAVDAHSAQATLADGPLSLTLLFRFNEAGLIGSFRAEARGAKVDGKLVMAPWEGSWSNYQLHGGMQVPCTGEVAWMRPEGRKPYFVGTVSSVAFEFAASDVLPARQR